MIHSKNLEILPNAEILLPLLMIKIKDKKINAVRFENTSLII
jgi:hypothetical protein